MEWAVDLAAGVSAWAFCIGALVQARYSQVPLCCGQIFLPFILLVKYVINIYGIESGANVKNFLLLKNQKSPLMGKRKML